jgi:hypothetical protein
VVTSGAGARQKEAAVAELRGRMSSISERGYAAGWMTNLEYDLWKLVRRGGGAYGRTVVTPAEVGILRALSARCGGWIARDDPTGDETLVPRAEWERRVQAAASAE